MEPAELEHAGKVELRRDRDRMPADQGFRSRSTTVRASPSRTGRASKTWGPSRSWPTRLTSRTSGCDLAQATTVARSCI